MKGEQTMKKSFAIIALAALVMLAGCKKNDPKPNGTRLIAGIEKHKSDSKTSLDGTIIKWSESDKLYVNNGTTPATFTLVSGAGTTTGEFATTGEYTFAAGNNLAVYPNNYVNGLDNTTVTMTLPAVQTASGAGSFGNGANPMMGTFSDMDNLTLTSLCGVLCLQLTGNAHITAIEIVGGPDDKLNGTFTVDYTSATPALAKSGDDGTNTVRLNFTETVTLTSTAQKFYVVVPAGTLHGFTMKVYNDNNEIFSKSTANEVPVYVNTLSTMNELEVTAASNIIDLSTLSESYTAQDGDIITGTANGSFSLRIPGDVSVTLRDVSGTEGFNIRCMDSEPGEHSVSINLEGNNSAYNFIQVAGIKNLTISGEGSLNLDNNMSFGPGCNTTIEGTTITGSLIYIGNEYSGEENTLTIDGGSVSINGGILAYNDTNINVENDGNLTLHVTKDDWFSTVFPGIEGSSGSEVNVTITDGVNGNSNLTIISYENSFTGDKFIKAPSISFDGTDVKEAWDAKTWSADGYQNFGPLRASYTASTKTLVLEPAPAPDYVFSVSNTTTVHFSPGNLQATTTDNGANWTWAFAANQWDYIGEAAANNSISGDGTVSENGTVDLFGWSTVATYYGINDDQDNGTYSGDFKDWGGLTIGSDAPGTWRTLTKDEWTYLFNGRSEKGVENRFAKAYLDTNSDGIGDVHGVILLPDNYTHPSGLNPIDGINVTGSTSYNSNNYNEEQWAQMEANGAVFLTAAGYRGISFSYVGERGYYWSSTEDELATTQAFMMNFSSGNLFPSRSNQKHYGNSVRLVSDAN